MFTAVLLTAGLAGQPPAAVSPPTGGFVSPVPFRFDAVPQPNLGSTIPNALPVFPVGRNGPPATTPDGTGNGAPGGNGKDAKDAKDGKGDEAKDNPNRYPPFLKPHSDEGGNFYQRLYREYYKQFFPDPDAKPEETPPPPRRALPSPWSAPPFPGDEYQGYPLIGVPSVYGTSPVMQALYAGPWGQQIKDSRITFEGWATSEGNVSTAKNSNVPTSYWIVPNRIELDQLVFKLERLPDTVQTDHWDWGFRSIAMYGIDYRYTTAGGWAKEHSLFEKGKKKEFVPKLVASQRQEEIALLDKLVPHLKAVTGKLWVLVVVLKQDLWVSQQTAVVRFYEEGDWGARMNEVRKALDGKPFFLHTVYECLHIQNYTTSGGHETLKKNTPGYDAVRQRESLAGLLQAFDALRNWEEKP